MSLRHLSFSKGFPSFCGKAGFLSSPSAGLTPFLDPSASASDELFSDFAKSSFWLLCGRTCAGMGFEFWQNSPSNPSLHWHLSKYLDFQILAIFSYNILKYFCHQYFVVIWPGSSDAGAVSPIFALVSPSIHTNNAACVVICQLFMNIQYPFIQTMLPVL